MLDKEICRRCQKHARESICQRALDIFQRNRLDESLQAVLVKFEPIWEDEKLVWCPALVAAQVAARALDDAKAMFAHTDGEPPEGCHYLLEHLMVNQIP